MADSNSVSVPTAARLLEALESNLNNLAEARDPQTIGLALELQNAIDRIRANLRQTGDLTNEPNRAGAEISFQCLLADISITVFSDLAVRRVVSS